jgi:hypothetical protein
LTANTGTSAERLFFISLAAVAAVLPHRLTEKVRVPAPALFFGAAAAATIPNLDGRPS